MTYNLKTSFIGRKVFYFSTLPSTMDKAREMAREGVGEGTVIVAGEQTAGRGRLKRTWISPRGNLALSIILYPDISNLPYLIMIASLAVVSALEKVIDLKAQKKWPNDILIRGKKVGGILIENEMNRNRVAFSIVGIGLNIDLDTKAHPEIATTAASLKSADKDTKTKLIKALLIEFERLYIILPAGKPVFEAWRERLVTLGKQVKATSANEVVKGTAEYVDETGALWIRSTDGSLAKVVAGDVTLRDK